MAIYEYKKYKISLRTDSRKTQGLQTGDIVRRQYFDGKNLIYSLMCVLDYGTDITKDSETKEEKEQNYFIGALLEGDEPQQEELLDFARVTNLFNTSRSGALYLTASDEQSPYMDVIDGIGRNASLCWPENIANTEYVDPQSQYVFKGDNAISVDYIKSEFDNYRIGHIVRNSTQANDYIGLQQDFYQYVENPNRVLVSYKIKSTTSLSAKASLGYADDTRIDGELNVTITTEWQYKFHAITVEWSGRHLRTFKLDLGDLPVNEEVWISDFNIILLSGISNFQDASQIRVGKLDGIVDTVFGKLDGYGGYLQKIFASGSAHVSGTLTAGDENGFGSTFYAGKIHRNVFTNSIEINFISEVTIESDLKNPVGVGLVYVTDSEMTMQAQNNGWLLQRIGKLYCFSFWAYAKQVCQLSIVQNGHTVGTIRIDYKDTHSWKRYSVAFELFEPTEGGDGLFLSIVPTFAQSEFDDAEDENTLYFSAPQLEAGKAATQYQPTDDVLNLTEDYGAWFNRGGIGGTIQNPLLQLNFDGDGSIGTRTKSFLLKVDGSGYLANMNIKWDRNGVVTFGDNVTLNWDNLSDDVKEEMVSKSIKINGADTFTLMGDISTNETSYSPQYIELSIAEENMESTSSQRQWYYLHNNEYVRLNNANGKTLTILPDGTYWGDSNTLTIKCAVTINQQVYSDTITIRKQHIIGYSVGIASNNGESFKNSECKTKLTANVYYQGQLVSPVYVEENFTFLWKKYHLPDLENEVQDWWKEQVDENGNVVQAEIDRTDSEIVLSCAISGRDLYICELQNGGMFPYTFPVIF